nr:MAG: hypothetical protein DIU68_02145 [Chloroflexota bacterium]
MSGPRAPITRGESSRQNPVAQAELAHLERSTRRSARLFTRGFALALGVSLLLGLGLGLMARSGSLTSVNLRENYLFFREVLRHANTALTLMLLLGHIVLMWETLLAAADSITREKRAGTWDTLVLTPLTAWQIADGKWWGVQAYIYRQQTGLIVLRVATFLWLILSSPHETMGVVALLVAFTLALAIMALNLALAAALGLVASFASRILSPVAIALCGYVTSILVHFGAHLLLFQPLLPGPRDATGFAASAMAVALLDGGTLLSTHLASFSDSRYLFALLRILPVSVILYAGLTGVCLLLARWHAMRHSAT